VAIQGNTELSKKRKYFKGFCTSLFEDLLAPDKAESYDNNNYEITIGGHEGIPVPLVRLLSHSAFGISKLPAEPKINTKTRVEDELDAEAFADMDEEAEENMRKLEMENVEIETETELELEEVNV
jgi:hypothetical protein